ncbi:class I adenylate-forming enzyme family protein [Rhodococcus opacus]|uniref:class I adenylate-forming enzyme family protein n=1 Tax=Rhodococcus opacus TaxID=37919 RepID=UPI002949A3EC|nr:class I adenylate-forming enzyme family protein [Rhodococcus opacus]MDV6244870.1 class I adenylate-forming enzyme family protein [Rhodococcus opacus]
MTTIRSHAAERPDALAVSDSHTSLTWSGFVDAIDRLAEDLNGIGVRPRDPVLLLLDSCVESVVAYWAVRQIDAIAVIGDPGCKRFELQHFLDSTGARYVLATRPGTLDRVEGTSEPLGVHWLLQSADRFEGLRAWSSWEDGASPRSSRVQVEDAAVILFSSGTTGAPKTIVHTRRSILALHHTQRDVWCLNANDIVLGALPFHTVYGAIFSAASAAYNGSSLVLVERFDARNVLGLIESERVTTAALVPTMIVMMLNVEEAFDLSSLRMTLTGSAPIAEEDISRFTALTGAPLLSSYGMTECPGAATERPGSAHRPGSAGQISPDFEVCARDDSGNPLTIGEIGEITLRGPTLMSGYLHQPELTASRIVDGWIHTQDIGFVDADGYIYVSGRNTDMIIRGGLNIAPREVEAVIGQHSAVMTCAVVGKDDRLYGQVVKAYVVLHPDALRSSILDDLSRHCLDRLSRAKVPVEFVAVRELPINAGGKVLRSELSAREEQLRIDIEGEENR